ncbi:hypothetical protein HK105_205719 [Polyrhizophydium stewartii]|uniref:Uncharacterized protein n=1 Tax=Polyrhizophydium stewartii TaxID=2732419 RepID=A0ABR4N5M1_9FUNG|nr:hypothetical protein HK105_006580 [Polyrhizophydium stewartii]
MGQSQNAKLGSQLLATSRSTEALRKTDAGLAVQRTDTGLPITPVLTRQQSQIAILGPDDEPISIPSSTADLAQRDKQFLHAKSFRIDDEGASPRSSVVSERSSVIERPSTCVVPEDEIDPDLDPVFVRCFPRSASGLCLLEPGWDTQVFADPKYNIWRRCVLEILQQQIDYPLIMPADLAAAINDEFGDF